MPMVVVLHCLARLDLMVAGRYTEHHLRYLKYAYSCELNCDMIFLGKRIRHKIKIGKKDENCNRICFVYITEVIVNILFQDGVFM